MSGGEHMDEQVGTWSYRTGDWFGVFGSATTLLLPASEKARVVALWAAIDDGASFDAVLDSLLQSGLGALPGFVLLGELDGVTRIIVRGPGVHARLTAGDDAVEVDGPPDATWAERVVAGVTSLSVAVPGAAGAADLPIDGGLVRVAQVDQPPVVPTVPDVAAPAAPVETVAEPEVVELPPLPSIPPPPPAPPAAWPEPPAPTEVLPEETPLPPLDALSAPMSPPMSPPMSDDIHAPTTPPPPFDEPAPEPEPLEPSPLDVEADTNDVTDLPPPPPPPAGFAPPPPPSGPPVSLSAWGPGPDAEPASDHDGLTHVGVDANEFAREQPGIPGQPMAPNVTAPVARIVMSSGQSYPVDRVILIGRAPEARRFTTTEQPLLVTVASPLHEISSTHLEIRPGSGADHGSAVVTDMGSTNGTVLVQPGLGPEDLKPGIAVQLIPGATINLGDGVTISVTNP